MKTLTDDLAALLGYLDAGGPADLESAAAEAFLRRLSDHVRVNDDVIFKALRESMPAAEELLRAPSDEHAALRLLASELSRRVSVDDRPGAAAVGRSFLAALAEHLRKEEEAVGAVVDRLHPDTADRLLRRGGLGEE